MYNMNEDYEQALSNLSDADRAVVDAIAEVAAAPQPKSSEGYRNLRATCTLTNGWDGANLNGWLHYEGGPDVSFTATGFSRRDGLPIAMVGGLPAGLGLSPERLIGKVARFQAVGYHGAGVLTIVIDGRSVTLPPIPLAGAGAFGWRIEGEVRFGG